MTLDEFMTELAKYKGEATVADNGSVRFSDCRCPIEKVFNLDPDTYSNWLYETILDGDDEDSIVLAADGQSRVYLVQHVRQRMLSVLGLSEPTE